MATFYVEDPSSLEADEKKEIACWCWNLGKWRQLEIWAWKPILDETYVIVILFAITALFLPVALYIQHENTKVTLVSQRYDNIPGCDRVDSWDGKGSTTDFPTGACTVNLTVKEDMKNPIFFYYELTNFYQTHRMYVKSRSEDQLLAKDPEKTNNCAPFEYGYDPETGKENIPLIPCGLIAASYFNDMFRARLIPADGSSSVNLCNSCKDDSDVWFEPVGPNGEPSSWQRKNIAWEIDREKYEASYPSSMTNLTKMSYTQNRTIPDIDDEDMLVWMRTAMSKNFKKLHRKITYTKGGYEGLKKDDVLQIDIRTFFPTKPFHGQKSVVISTSSRLGGANVWFWRLYLITGSCSGLCGIWFLVVFYRDVSNKEKERRQGPSS